MRNIATRNDVDFKKFDLKYAHRVLILLALLAVLVMYVDIMLTPSLPAIGAQYHIDSAQASLIISLYLVFGTAIVPIVGKLGDIFGKKRMLMYVLVMYIIMVTITSFVNRFDIILISRTFQGIGLSMFPLSFSLIREEFPRELVPRAQGLIAGMFGGGTALGLPIGAYVANSYGWQANYHIVLPFLIVLTILIYFIIKESKFTMRNAKLDYVGAAWLGTSLAMIVLGISQGAIWGWTSYKVLGLSIGGLVLLLPLIFFERIRSNPILDLKLLSQRNVLISNLIALVISLSMFLAFQAISYKMELSPPSGFGFDILTTGLYLLPLAITMLVLAYPIGILVSKFGVKKFLFIGSVLGMIGFVLLSTATTAIRMAEYLVVAAAGIGILMISIQNLLVLSVQLHDMGIATSLNNVFRNMGSSMGAPIAGSLISTYTIIYIVGSKTFSLPSTSAFQYSFYVAIAGFTAAFILSFFAKEVIDLKHSKKKIRS